MGYRLSAFAALMLVGPVVAADVAEISADVLEDKIRGGLIAQILGNLNGLPHENQYIDEPGSVSGYVPALPEGARSDDDTDIEWVYLYEMQRRGEVLLPADAVVKAWQTHINERIWCANRYARLLMDLGIEPPLTGRAALNPWSGFNISGQFICEAFGLIAPGMPQTASRIGLHYTHVTIEGEPAQTTQLFATMIATAFFEDDVNRILDAGLTAVDPESEIHAIVTQVRRWHRQHARDWKRTRALVKQAYTRYGGGMADRNGYPLNTASTIAALLYGAGDLVRTLETAFNFGWDADNNAATAATIIGVIRGKRWVDSQGWNIGDRYANVGRDGMPMDETITRYGDRLLALARTVILEQGGEEIGSGGAAAFRIHRESPEMIESLADSRADRGTLKEQCRARVQKDLGSGDDCKRAAGAYLAICLDMAAGLRERRPADWEEALGALSARKDLRKALYDDKPGVFGTPLQTRARAAGWTATQPAK